MMREKQLPWSIFIGVSLTFVDNSLTFVDRFFFRTLTILYFRTFCFLFLESGILYFVLHFCYLFRSPDFISESGILDTRTLSFCGMTLFWESGILEIRRLFFFGMTLFSFLESGMLEIRKMFCIQNRFFFSFWGNMECWNFILGDLAWGIWHEVLWGFSA